MSDIRKQFEEKAKDLWNWVALNMVDNTHTSSIRLAQKFQSEFRGGMIIALTNAYTKGAEEERARVLEEVAGEIKRQLEITLMFRESATLGQEVSEWPSIIRGFIKHFIYEKYLRHTAERKV